jgi:hypothetical protein
MGQQPESSRAINKSVPNPCAESSWRSLAESGANAEVEETGRKKGNTDSRCAFGVAILNAHFPNL